MGRISCHKFWADELNMQPIFNTESDKFFFRSKADRNKSSDLLAYYRSSVKYTSVNTLWSKQHSGVPADVATQLDIVNVRKTYLS